MFGWFKRLFGAKELPQRGLTPEELAEGERASKRTRKRIKEYGRRLRTLDSIYDLNVEEAKRLFNEGVEAGAFEVVYEPATNTEILKAMAPHTRDLFTSVSYIYINMFGEAIDRDSFSLDIYPGYLCIGGEELRAYLIKLGSDEFYIFESDDDNPHAYVENDQIIWKTRKRRRSDEEILRDLEPSDPTIYHWLLDQAAFESEDEEDE